MGVLQCQRRSACHANVRGRIAAVKTGGGAGGGWLKPENAVSDKTCLICFKYLRWSTDESL